MFYSFGELLTENEKEWFHLLAHRLKMDKSCRLACKPLVSVFDTICPCPWHFGKVEEERIWGKKRPEMTFRWTWQPLVKKLRSNVRAAVIPPGELSIFSLRPKSQMVLGAFGTLQSYRLKKLSAVFMQAERRMRQQHFTAVIQHFKAAFNVSVATFIPLWLRSLRHGQLYAILNGTNVIIGQYNTILHSEQRRDIVLPFHYPLLSCLDQRPDCVHRLSRCVLQINWTKF